jgi:hypothetical protein
LSVTFGLSGTTPFADYNPAGIADLIYKYFGQNWSITTPATIDKMAIFLSTNPAQMVNRPNPGNRSLWLWVQHAILDSGRTIPGSTFGRRGDIMHNHVFNVHLMMWRAPQGMTFPELDIMSGEIERLVYQFHLAPIPGIERLDRFMLMGTEEATTLGEAFSGMYKQTCQVTANYWKTSTV